MTLPILLLLDVLACFAIVFLLLPLTRPAEERRHPW